MDYLEQLESKSIYIIREAYWKFNSTAMLWSIGKDSTVMLWLMRKAFFDCIPFPVIHIDTTYKFEEIIHFRDKMTCDLNLDLVIAKNDEALEQGVDCTNKIDCCNLLKTMALKRLIATGGFDALFVGIRRDEHGIRAKERVFSPRNHAFQWNYKTQPLEVWGQYSSIRDKDNHVRIHPLLHWTELNIWEYIKKENIPVVSLYFGKGGLRYRSIGCECCCQPIQSEADSVESVIRELKLTNSAEREGRTQEKEDPNTMQKLRALGYL